MGVCYHGTMNYIGSKFSLLPEIETMLRAHGLHAGTFIDLFSGTATVAQWAKKQGFEVHSNDWQHFSYVVQRALIQCSTYPTFATLTKAEPFILTIEPDPVRPTFGLGPMPDASAQPLLKVLTFLEGLSPQSEIFSEQYCEGGVAQRCYFNQDNGGRITAIRNTIAGWREQGLLSDDEFYLLLASLLEGSDRVANTASVYGAYLKHIKKTAQNPIKLALPRLIASTQPNQAYQQDGTRLIEGLSAVRQWDILYIDPPYNHRQYHANYHVLETIACWDLDAFTPEGKTGLRPGEHLRSPFCSRKHVANAFDTLITTARVKHILVSYNNEGLLSEDTLQSILTRKACGGIRDFKTLDYRRFRADNNHAQRQYRRDVVREFLYFIAVKA